MCGLQYEEHSIVPYAQHAKISPLTHITAWWATLQQQIDLLLDSHVLVVIATGIATPTKTGTTATVQGMTPCAQKFIKSHSSGTVSRDKILWATTLMSKKAWESSQKRLAPSFLEWLLFENVHDLTPQHNACVRVTDVIVQRMTYLQIVTVLTLYMVNLMLSLVGDVVATTHMSMCEIFVAVVHALAIVSVKFLS